MTMPDGGVATEPASGDSLRPVAKFTWEDLSKLNRPHNAHVAVRGKVRRKRSKAEQKPS